MKYAVIGDIHGHYEALNELLQLIPNDRQIISVGDLCDKGNDFYNCFLALKQKNALVVLGNHDQWHLRYQTHEDKKKTNSQYINPMKSPKDDKLETREQILKLPFDGFEWMRTWPMFVKIPEHNVVVLHGGLEKNLTPERTKKEIICRVRYLNKNGTMSYSLLDDGCFWADVYEDNPVAGTIIYGHANAKEPRIRKHSFGIDTSAVYGYKLSALLLPEFEIISVPARKISEPHYEVE